MGTLHSLVATQRITHASTVVSITVFLFTYSTCADTSSPALLGWGAWNAAPVLALSIAARRMSSFPAGAILGTTGVIIAALWIALAWSVATQAHHSACLQIGWIYLLGPAVALAFVGIAVAIAAIFHAARRKNLQQPGG
jgi:hypothetical protein